MKVRSRPKLTSVDFGLDPQLLPIFNRYIHCYLTLFNYLV